MPPLPSSDRPLILAVGFHRLQKLLQELAPEYREQVDVEIISSRFEQAMLDIQARHRQRRVEAVVSAGTNGQYLAAQLDLPVVQVRVDGHDILKALTTARGAPGRIALLLHGEIPRHVEDFVRAFQLDVILRSYRSPQEAQACVRELSQDAVTTVVAPGLITDLAEHAGLTGVFLYSHESVRRALNEAVTLVRASRAELARFERHSLTSQTTPLDPSASPKLPGETRRRRGASNTTRYTLKDLIGHDPSLQTVKELALRFAQSDATVLITGETGTGKEIVAQGIHAASARRKQPFIAINCGALPETLLESELFGYVEGAFTGARRGGHTGLFEAAHGGTLLLDEIGELPASLQSRLLRVLQERQVLRLGATEPVPVDVRIVAATHQDLAHRVEQQLFRMDLYYRLNILRLRLPPLRERAEDLPTIAEHRLQALAQSTGLSPQTVLPYLPPFLQLTQQHDWPGNVRELENYLERLLVSSAGLAPHQALPELLDVLPELAEQSPVELQSSLIPPPKPRKRGAPISPADLDQALAATGSNREDTARLLGISRTTLWRYLKQYQRQ